MLDAIPLCLALLMTSPNDEVCMKGNVVTCVDSEARPAGIPRCTPKDISDAWIRAHPEWNHGLDRLLRRYDPVWYRNKKG